MEPVHDNGIDQTVKELIRNKARWLSRRRSFAHCGSEDIEQELVVYLLKARTTFQPERDWHRFASTVIRNAVANLVRDSRALKRCRHRTVQLADIRDEDECELQSLAGQQVHDHRRQQNRLLLELDIQALTATLLGPEQELVQMLKSKTVSEIARSDGTSRETVYENIRRLRERFERADLRDYLDRS